MDVKMNANKNIAIDNIKFILAILIILHHIYECIYQDHKELYFLHGGFLAVEAFFIISGYFLMHSIETKNKTIQSYFEGRIKRLMPDYIFVAVLSIVLCILYGIDYDPKKVLSNVLLFNCFLGYKPVNNFLSLDWYISNLFFLSLLFFSLSKLSKLTGLTIIYSVALIGLGMKLNLYGNLIVHSEPILLNVTGAGLLRAWIAMSAGLLVYQIKCYVEKLNTLSINIFSILALSVCFYSVKNDWYNETFINFIVSFAMLVVILSLKRSFFYSLLNIKVLYPLSKLSYLMYLLNFIGIFFYKQYLYDYFGQNVFLSVLIVIAIIVLMSWILSKIKSYFYFLLNYVLL